MPVGLAYFKEQLIVAIAEIGLGSNILLNANRRTAVREITSPLILPPSGLSVSNNEALVSYGNHLVVKFDVRVYDANVEVLRGTQDGEASSALFQSPHGLATMDNSIFICDTGNKRIRLISSSIPLTKLSSVVRLPLCKGF